MTKAYEVGDEISGHMGGDIIRMRCKECGCEWRVELPAQIVHAPNTHATIEQENKRLREALQRIRAILLTDQPSFRCDDPEGAMNTAHAIAQQALAKKGGEA